MRAILWIFIYSSFHSLTANRKITIYRHSSAVRGTWFRGSYWVSRLREKLLHDYAGNFQYDTRAEGLVKTSNCSAPVFRRVYLAYLHTRDRVFMLNGFFLKATSTYRKIKRKRERAKKKTSKERKRTKFLRNIRRTLFFREEIFNLTYMLYFIVSG